MGNAEWNFFKRIENLERDIEAAKPTLKDVTIVAIWAFGLSFADMAVHSPDRARKLKDSYMKDLKTSGLSPGTLNMLERAMLAVCDIVEESRR